MYYSSTNQVLIDWYGHSCWIYNVCVSVCNAIVVDVQGSERGNQLGTKCVQYNPRGASNLKMLGHATMPFEIRADDRWQLLNIN